MSYRLHHAPVRDLLANFCFNIENCVGLMVWPIFLAVEIHSYKSIGLMSALAAVVSVVVVAIAGHRGDGGRSKRVLQEGVAASSVIDFLRIVPLNPVGVTMLGAGYRASLAYMYNPWSSTYYYHTKRKGTPYVMSMEIVCDLAYLFLWVSLWLASLVASTHAMFVYAFVLAGVLAWGCLLISDQETGDEQPLRL